MRHILRLACLAALIFGGGCVSLAGPRAATGRAYAGHVTLMSELNNFEAEEGRRLLDASPATEAGRAQYSAAIDAFRKACDFTRGLLARELKGIEEIKASLSPAAVR